MKKLLIIALFLSTQVMADERRDNERSNLSAGAGLGFSW